MNNPIAYSSDYENNFMFLSWDDVHNRVEKLANLLSESKTTELSLIGVFQGGWIIAQILADYYPDIPILGATWKKTGDVYLSTIVNTQDDFIDDCSLYLKDREIVLVDEVVESGRTLESHTNSLRRYRPKNILSCSIFCFTTTTLKPNIFLEEVAEPTNIIFPWRIRRDFNCFLGVYAKDNILSTPIIKRHLYREYGISLNERFIEERIAEFAR